MDERLHTLTSTAHDCGITNVTCEHLIIGHGSHRPGIKQAKSKVRPEQGNNLRTDAPRGSGNEDAFTIHDCQSSDVRPVCPVVSACSRYGVDQSVGRSLT